MIADSDAVRWWQKVIPTDGCWHWTGASRSRAGYGIFWLRDRNVYPHRVAYEIGRGPIPEGMTLDHLCRNPGCVNPDHLEPVSMKENLLRGEGVGAVAARRTCCVHGHALDGTYRTRGRTVRYCRECSRRKLRERRRRRR